MAKLLAFAVLLCACAAVQVNGNLILTHKHGWFLGVTTQGAAEAAPAPAPAPHATLVAPAPAQLDRHHEAPPNIPEGTKVTFEQNTDKDAAHVLEESRAEITNQADEKPTKTTCGTGVATQTYASHCRIIATFRDSPGKVINRGCSAAQIGNNRLATAAHCFFRTDKGWARSVDVYCTGQDACNSGRTTAATDGIVTPRWKAAVLNPQKTRLMVGDDEPWDLGVIRTAGNLPGPAVSLAQYTAATTTSVRLTGYPARSPDTTGCNDHAYTGCTQISSFSTMFTSQAGAYTSKGLQMCNGQSGSGIIDSDGKLVAIASSAYTGDGGKCTNAFLSPNITPANVDGGTCERAAGGASLECLSKKLPA